MRDPLKMDLEEARWCVVGMQDEIRWLRRWHWGLLAAAAALGAMLARVIR